MINRTFLFKDRFVLKRINHLDYFVVQATRIGLISSNTQTYIKTKINAENICLF